MEKLGIIVLNWNTSKETIECLKSLKDQTFTNFRIYLVDNGSKTEEVKMLEHYLNKEKELNINFIKWDTEEVELHKFKDITPLCKYMPLFGDRRKKTLWLVFMKM